jgi:hypothetical protein
MGDFFLLQMDDCFTEGLYHQGGEGGAPTPRSPILLRAKRRAAPKGGNSAAKRHCKSRIPVGPVPVGCGYAVESEMPTTSPHLAWPISSASRIQGSAFAPRRDVLSPVREKRVESHRREIRSGPGSKLSVRQPVYSPLVGWRTVASDPSISPWCSAPSTLTQA